MNMRFGAFFVVMTTFVAGPVCADVESQIRALEWKVSDLERDMHNVERSISNQSYDITRINNTLRSLDKSIDQLKKDVEELQHQDQEPSIAALDVLAGKRLAELVGKDCTKARSMYETMAVTEPAATVLLMTFKSALNDCFEEPVSQPASVPAD